MKPGVVGLDDVHINVWKCLGEQVLVMVTKLFNKIIGINKMSREWRRVFIYLYY